MIGDKKFTSARGNGPLVAGVGLSVAVYAPGMHLAMSKDAEPKTDERRETFFPTQRVAPAREANIAHIEKGEPLHKAHRLLNRFRWEKKAICGFPFQPLHVKRWSFWGEGSMR